MLVLALTDTHVSVECSSSPCMDYALYPKVIDALSLRFRQMRNDWLVDKNTV